MNYGTKRAKLGVNGQPYIYITHVVEDKKKGRILRVCVIFETRCTFSNIDLLFYEPLYIFRLSIQLFHVL